MKERAYYRVIWNPGEEQIFSVPLGSWLVRCIPATRDAGIAGEAEGADQEEAGKFGVLN